MLVSGFELFLGYFGVIYYTISSFEEEDFLRFVQYAMFKLSLAIILPIM